MRPGRSDQAVPWLGHSRLGAPIARSGGAEGRGAAGPPEALSLDRCGKRAPLVAEYTIGNSPKEGRRARSDIECGERAARVCKAGSAKTGPGQGPGNRMGFKDLKLGTRADKLVSARPGTTVC